MNRQLKVAIPLGILFLAVGVVWLSAIFIRCDVHRSWKKPVQSQRSSAEVDKKAPDTTLKDLAIQEFLSKKHIALFWAIAYLEAVCALLYLLSGVSLLRGYPFRRELAMGALSADAALKVAVALYQQQVILPLKDIFKDTNVLLVHFAPDGSFASQVSVYLAGVKLIQPGWLCYAVAYAVLLLGLLGTLTHPKTKNYF